MARKRGPFFPGGRRWRGSVRVTPRVPVSGAAEFVAMLAFASMRGSSSNEFRIRDIQHALLGTLPDIQCKQIPSRRELTLKSKSASSPLMLGVAATGAGGLLFLPEIETPALAPDSALDRLRASGTSRLHGDDIAQSQVWVRSAG